MSLIGKSIGNYLIKAKLGEGGMGAVYLGEHPLIGKRVAVKVLLEELASKEDIVQRFFNEAKAVNDIGHQNIVDIVDFGKMKSEQGGDIVYFIMEFLDGESLAARLRRTGLSFKETMHVMTQCCSALTASHAKGIVHRDLKPENIYLCPRGTDKNFIKILDFGIAKLTGDGAASSKTRTGLVIGTPSYMSPEQCEGKGLIDHRSDVYSLGVVMYELLTGRVPFPGEGFGEILVAHLTKTPEPPSQLNPDIRPEVEAIVMHSLEKDRNRRFQSMAEFAAAVEDPADHLAHWSQLPGYQAPAHTGNTGSTMMIGTDQPTVRGNTGGMGTVKGPMTGSGPRPTTLSGAAAEMGGASGGRSRAPLFAALTLFVVAAGGAAWYFTRPKVPVDPTTTTASNNNTTTPQTHEVVAPPTAPAGITITINSTPAGAKVFRAGMSDPDGVTPFVIKAKKGDPSFDVQLRLEGYTSMTKTVTTEGTAILNVAMTAIPGTPETTTVTAANTPTGGGSSSHHSSSSGSTSSSHDKGHKGQSSDGKKKGSGDKNDDMILLTPKF